MTEITTVSTMTTSARRKERQNAPPISTDPVFDSSTSNQWSETPRIGKTSPPSGPWKESATMATIGPQRKTTKSAKAADRA